MQKEEQIHEEIYGSVMGVENTEINKSVSLAWQDHVHIGIAEL